MKVEHVYKTYVFVGYHGMHILETIYNGNKNYGRVLAKKDAEILAKQVGGKVGKTKYQGTVKS